MSYKEDGGCAELRCSNCYDGIRIIAVERLQFLAPSPGDAYYTGRTQRADGQKADLCMVFEFGLLRSLIQNRLEGITQCEAGGWRMTHSGEHIRMCEFLPRLILSHFVL